MNPRPRSPRSVIDAMVGLSLLVAAACGARSAPTPRNAGPGDVASLFPRGDVPLSRSATLRALPAQTLAALIVPSLDAARAYLDARAGLDPEIANAVHALASARLGQDILDRGRMQAAGVDTESPVALALLDLDTAAVVLPLADRVRFKFVWRAIRGTTFAVHDDHAVVAFALEDGVLDPTGESVRALAWLEPSRSLAAHPQLLDVATRLGYGPDLLLFANIDALRPALLQYLDEERDRVDLQAVRELVDIAAERDDALDELAAAEREIERLDAWQTVISELLAPMSAVVVGLGFESSAIKARVAFGLDTSARSRLDVEPWLVSVPTGSAGASTSIHHALASSLRLPRAALVPAVRLLVSRRAFRRFSDVVARLGGAGAFDGDFAITITSSPRGSRRLALRIGVRDDPTRARERIRATPTPDGWRVRIDGHDLVIDERPRGAVGVLRAPNAGTDERISTMARLVTQARGAGATAFIDWRAMFAGSDQGAVAATPSGADPTLDQVIADMGDDLHDTYRALLEEQAKLVRARQRAIARARDSLIQALRASGVALVQEPRGPAAFVVTTVGRDEPAHVLGHALAWLYHGSELSAESVRLSELESRILAIEADHHVVTISDGKVERRMLDRSSLKTSQLSSGAGTGAGTQPIMGTGRREHERVRATIGADNPRLSASITRADPQLDRMVLDRWLLQTLPRLRQCYDAVRASRKKAGGYMRAELEVAADRLRVTGLAVAPTARELDDQAMRGCVVTSIEAARLAPAMASPGTGTATATLFFTVD